MPLDATTEAPEIMAGVDLRGHTAIVTGATTGLGLVTATFLAKAGARVVVGARNEAKGRATVETITAEVEGALVDYGAIDLSSLDSVRSFAEGFIATIGQIPVKSPVSV